MTSSLRTSALIIITIAAFSTLNYSCKKVPDLVPQKPGQYTPVTPDSLQPNIILILADDVGYEVPTVMEASLTARQILTGWLLRV